MAAIKSQTTVYGDILDEPTYLARREGKAASLCLMMIHQPRAWDADEQRYLPTEAKPTRIRLQFTGETADRVRLLFDRGVLKVGLPVTAHGRLSDKPYARLYQGRVQTSHLVYAEDIDIDLVTLATRDPQLRALAAWAACA